jgi:lipopolysaccharide export system permease protein
MFPLIARYILGQTVRGLLVALSVVLVLILLVDFVEQTRTVDVAVDGAGLFDYAGLTLLKTPMLVETTLPFIVLSGVMLTMFALNRRSELVVMRAAGISAWRFVTPPVAVAIVAGILSITLLNPMATRMVQRFEDARETLTGGVDTRDRAGTAWFIELGNGERRMIRADAVDAPNLTLTGVTFEFFDLPDGGDAVFTRRLDAETATYADGEWIVRNAVESIPGSSRRYDTLNFPAYLDVAALGQNANAQAVSFWELPGAARAAREVGVSPAPYQMRWLRLLMTPVLFIAMALIAAAASLRLQRLGGAVRLIVLGGAAGFGLYFLGDMLDAFALSGRLPMILAAAAAPVGATLAALAVIAHQEDS